MFLHNTPVKVDMCVDEDVDAVLYVELHVERAKAFFVFDNFLGTEKAENIVWEFYIDVIGDIFRTSGTSTSTAACLRSYLRMQKRSLCAIRSGDLTRECYCLSNVRVPTLRMEKLAKDVLNRYARHGKIG